MFLFKGLTFWIRDVVWDFTILIDLNQWNWFLLAIDRKRLYLDLIREFHSLVWLPNCSINVPFVLFKVDVLLVLSESLLQSESWPQWCPFHRVPTSFHAATPFSEPLSSLLFVLAGLALVCFINLQSLSHFPLLTNCSGLMGFQLIFV